MREGWEYKKLGEVCCPKNKIQRAARCFDSSDKILYIDISSIDNTMQKVTDITSVTFGDAPSRAQQKIEYGDIVVSTVRPNLKNIAIIDRYEPNIVASSGFCVLRNTECIERNYLFHYVTSDIFTQHLMKITTGANYPAVRDQDVRDSIIPLPPKSTQLAIVSELDKINELIRLKKEQLKDFDNLAQSIFYEMFGDPVKNEKGWEMKKLKDVCEELFAGGDVPKANCSKTKEGSKIYPIYTNGIVNEGLYGYTDIVRVDKPSLTISARGTIGAVFKRKANYYPAIRLITVVPQDKLLDLDYTMFALKGLCIEGAGGTIPQLTVPTLKLYNVQIPPLPLQHLFAQRIEQIEHQKAEVQKAIVDIETLLASRMQYWFE